jgi:hypothetical protein
MGHPMPSLFRGGEKMGKKGISSFIENLIVKLYTNTPLSPDEDEFCMGLVKEKKG